MSAARHLSRRRYEVGHDRHRRGHHRRGPQRPHLRGLSGDGRTARKSRRAPQGGRRRRGDGGISPRLSQFGRGLHRKPAQSEDYRGSEAARPWLAHRRAPRAEFSARARRQLSADRRGPHPSVHRKTQRARRRPDRRLQRRTAGDRRRAAPIRAARAAEHRAGFRPEHHARSHQRARHREHLARP